MATEALNCVHIQSITPPGLCEMPRRSANSRVVEGLLSKALTVAIGSGRELPSSKLIALKLPLRFRFPEAALGH